MNVDGQPLVFISHDSRDATMARDFSTLLREASGGNLRSFNSSGTRGIEPGREWYQVIVENLQGATDVVALLTRRSIGRPWILYEAGFAKGRERASVFGVALGLPLEEAIRGPFAQFQNCAGEEDALTDLVMALIQRNLKGDPSEEAVRRSVKAFLRKLVKTETAIEAEPPEERQDLAAKVYEEIKLIGRDQHKPRLTKILGPDLYREFPLSLEDGSYDATGWLLLLSVLREDLPWLYELGLDLHRALGKNDRAAIERAQEQVLRSVRAAAQNTWLRSIIAEKDRELAFRLHYLPDLVAAYLLQLEPIPPQSKGPGTASLGSRVSSAKRSSSSRTVRGRVT